LRENAGFGPGDDEAVSPLGNVLPVSTDTDDGGGGGSITETVGVDLDTGSGRESIGSSADEVSIVICLVAGGDCLRVYIIGEHLTTTDGFLWPGRWATGGLLIPPRV
jgi:hypothetical protein